MTIGPGDAIGGRVFAEISKDLSQTKPSSNIQIGWAIRPSLNTFDEIPKPSVFLSLIFLIKIIGNLSHVILSGTTSERTILFYVLKSVKFSPPQPLIISQNYSLGSIQLRQLPWDPESQTSQSQVRRAELFQLIYSANSGNNMK